MNVPHSTELREFQLPPRSHAAAVQSAARSVRPPELVQSLANSSQFSTPAPPNPVRHGTLRESPLRAHARRQERLGWPHGGHRTAHDAPGIHPGDESRSEGATSRSDGDIFLDLRNKASLWRLC
ncbi:hypothetical protein M758_8G188700 [Ceratodon purpureus]|nr:hypothetical protein M758_8G188700 [Ceratodon purpureus]